MNQVKHCTQCGIRLIGDEIYCRHCGTRINWNPIVPTENEEANYPKEAAKARETVAAIEPSEDTEPAKRIENGEDIESVTATAPVENNEFVEDTGHVKVVEPVEGTEAAKPAEKDIELVKAIGPVELTEPGEATEPAEDIELVEATGPVEVAEPEEATEIVYVTEFEKATETVAPIQSAEATEPAVAIEAGDDTGPTEVVEPVEAPEPAKPTEEDIESGEVTELTEAIEAAEATEPIDTTDTIETTESTELVHPSLEQAQQDYDFLEPSWPTSLSGDFLQGVKVKAKDAQHWLSNIRSAEVFSKASGFAKSALEKLEPIKPKAMYILIGIVGVIAIAIGIALAGGDGDGTKTFAVQFNPNGGSGGPPSVEVKKDKSVAKPKEEPTLSGYEFSGWFKDRQGEYKYDFTTPVYDDITLYAGWEAEDLTVTTPVPEAEEAETPKMPKTVGETDQIEKQTPSYYVTSKAKSGIYVRKDPYVPQKADDNKIMYIKPGDTSVRLTSLNQSFVDKSGYTWFKVSTSNGIGWVREDIVRANN